MRRIEESRWRTIKLCYWPDQGALPAKGKGLKEDISEVSMERHARAKQLVIFFGAAGIGTGGAWSQQRDQAVQGLMWCLAMDPHQPPQPQRSSQEATQPAASEPGPNTPSPAKRSKRTKAEQAAEPTQPTKRTGKAQGKADKVKPAPQPGRWLDRDCNAALNMQRIGESRWRPLELCWWPEQGALPAKGKEYPGLGYKRLRDEPPKAPQQQQQQPAEAHDTLDRDEALQPDLTDAESNRKASGEARAARNRINTYHGKKCKLAHLTRHFPRELWNAFLADAALPRVKACSERAVLASLLLGLLVRGLFTIDVADPLGLHDQPVYTDIPVSQAAIPDLSCRNLFLQLCHGLPGDGSRDLYPASSEQACDICSNGWSGNWEHLHCRGAKATECDGAVVDGVQDVNLDGPVPRQFCALRSLREFDLDGGQLTGPIPRWLLEPNPDPAANGTLCGSNIQELDLSSNRLSGTIPPEFSIKKSMQEFKIEHNHVTGTLPESFGQLPDLWRIRLATNHMTGRMPQSLSNLTATLNELWLDNNDFEGDLYMLGPTKLVWVTAPRAPRNSQEATQPAASEPGPNTPSPAKRSKRTKAEQAAEPTQPTKGAGQAQGKAAKAKTAPQLGRWLDRDSNAALNMQRIGESRWRPLELCWWPGQGALPAKGKEYLA
ncbi:hypothetical protein QJQ45_020902 [Haematococcus lacustris]|nr:hypothetical protein QJQ45_020902 [Haematococcus lacustris]